MKILFVAALTIAAALVWPARAAPWPNAPGSLVQVQMQRDRPGQVQRPPPREVQRPPQPPERGQRGDGRMTNEERRGLHRDLDRANREIYKGRGR